MVGGGMWWFPTEYHSYNKIYVKKLGHSFCKLCTENQGKGIVSSQECKYYKHNWSYPFVF